MDRKQVNWMRIPFLLTVVLAAAGVAPAEEQASPIHELSWLAGCWEQRWKSRVTQEHWMPPLGRSMFGLSRTVTGDRTVAHEYLRIEESDGKLVLIALPSGQSEARFEQIELTGSRVWFANPDHDYPQRIGYLRLPDGSIVGRIEGEQDGKTRAVDSPMVRIPCDPGDR